MSNFNSGYPPPPTQTPYLTGWQQTQQQQPSPLQAQPTGWQQPQATGWQQPQPTGFQRPQPTGYASPSFLQPQQTSFLQPQQSPNFIQPQATGWQSPQSFNQLNMMTQSLLPNASPFGNSLPQSFQQAPAPPKIPWKLSRDEKRNYDQIFRAWDSHSTGFISGDQAREVFGQSGLASDDLMMIWNLADIENRGKLNLAEFHVAMALVYRSLNGNTIPDELPDELIPPSSKDLNMQVDILKDILKHDNHQRITSPQLPSARSDASIYKHDDNEAASSTYKSSSRHIDRRNVRHSNSSPASDLEDMKRELANTSVKLDKATSLSGNRTQEDDELERDMDDLKYSIRRVQDDLDFVSSGRPSREKDQERRQLERELLYLMHDRLPEVEKRMQRAHSRKKDTEREALRYRDHRNDRYRRYRDEDDDDDYYRRPSSPYSNRRERDYDYEDRRGHESPSARGYMRGTYDDRPPPEPLHPRVADKTPPPPPPVAQPKEVDTTAKSPPPMPSQSTGNNLRGMSAEARKNYIQNEAQKRVQERLKALGVTSGDETSSGAESVAERLEREKREAVERAQKEDEARSRREQERLRRVEEEKSARNPPPAEPVKSQPTGKKAPPPPPSRRQAPPAPPARTPSQAVEAVQRGEPSAGVAPPQAPPAQPQHYPEDEMLEQRRRAKEARMKALEDEERELAEAEKRFKERQAKLRAEDEARQAAAAAPVPIPAPAPAPAPAPPVPIPTPVSVPRAVPSPQPSIPPAPPVPAAPPVPSPQAVATPAPPAPPAPVPVPAAAPPSPAPQPPQPPQHQHQPPPPPQASAQDKESTNPFVRMQQQKERGELPPSSIETPAAPSPVAPVPTMPKSTHLTNESDDDWGEDAQEKSDEDDSSDDEFSSRAKRDNLAKVLFGGMVGGSGSSTPNAGAETPTTPTAAPSAPAPPAPAAPAAPQSRVAPAQSSGPADRGSLMSQIKGGMSLKKSQTNDRSKPASGGGVIGDDAPPDHISDAPREHDVVGVAEPEPQPAPVPVPDEVESKSPKKDNRQSVDWISGLATDGGVVQHAPELEQVAEEHDDDYVKVPSISIDPTDTLAEEFDLHSVIKCRSLYAYAPQRDEDLAFTENVIIEANPCRDSESPWWYGKLTASGQSGYLPKAYVKELDSPVGAKALYDYTANSQDEFSLYEGQSVIVVDRSDSDWWKISTDDGLIGNIPAAYVELQPDGDVLSVQDIKSNTESDLESLTESESESEVESKSESSSMPEQEPESELTPRPRPVRREAPDLPRPKSTIESPTHAADAVQPAEIKGRRQRSQSDALERTRTQDQPSSQPLQPQPSSRLGDFFGRFRSNSNASTADETSSGSGVIVSRPVSRPISQQSNKSSNWSSLINQSALDSFSSGERNRQEAIFELIKSEGVYVKDLTAIVEVYLANLIQEIDGGTLEMIFSNIEDILLLNATFVSDLEMRQRNERLYISQIGDLLDKHLSNLNMYKQYCSNQHRSIKVLQTLQNNNYRLSQKLIKLKEDPTSRNLELSTHLLSPMQRITRYPLLIKHILKYTEKNTLEYASIEKALDGIEQLLSAINEDVRVQESHTRLHEISNSLVMGQKVDLSNTRTSKRILIKEGQLAKSKSNKIIHVVLCNDILLLINVVERTLYKLPIPLKEISATAHPKREDVINLDLAYPRGGENIALKTQDRNAWINTINSTKKVYKQ